MLSHTSRRFFPRESATPPESEMAIVSLLASLLHLPSCDLHRPTPWQRGFWRDPVRPGLTVYGLGLVVVSIQVHDS